jgi:6-phosphogluconolactonase
MAYPHLRSVSRRGFCFLVAIATLPSCKSMGPPASEVVGPSSPTTSDGVVVYAGVGRSLRVYALDTRTGDLELRQTVPDLSGDVQYVAVHPTRRWLYVSCTEVPAPKDRPQVSAIYAFGIDAKTGALAQLGQPYTPPLSRAININVDNTGRFLLLAHNITESASVLGLNADGSLGQPVQQPEELQHLGFLVHQIRIDPSNRWVIVPVRGDDEKLTGEGKGKKLEPEKPGHLVVFEFSEGRLTRRHQVDFPSPLGPRHLDFHPSKPLVYVSMERGNRLLTYRHDNGVLTKVFDTTTLADPSLAFPAQRAGAIHVHPSGKWVYVVNRNTQPCSAARPCDTPSGPGENDVAVFSIDPATGEPRLIQNVGTHGFEARTMTIDPTSRFLIVANQKAFSLGYPRQADKVVEVAPNLSVFRIGDDGKLSYLRTIDLTGGEAWWVGAVARP